MARRKKTSPAEDLMDLVAMLPWWAGLVLALLSYLLLHSVASQSVVVATQPGQMGAMVTQTLWKSLASVGQYLVPIICLAGAGVSAWRRKERKNLVVGVTPKLMRGNGGMAADIDAGVMAWAGKFRVGLVARNLTTPEFGRDEQAIELAREVRVGGKRRCFSALGPIDLRFRIEHRLIIEIETRLLCGQLSRIRQP